MFEKEEVINWLRNCDGHAIHTGHGCEKCPFLEGTESGEECVERLHAAALELLKKDDMDWTEVRNTIRELRNNNQDKPDVVNTMHYLLELMKVIREQSAQIGIAEGR